MVTLYLAIIAPVCCLASVMHFSLPSGEREFSHEVVLLLVHIKSASWEINFAAGFKCKSKSETPESLSEAMFVARTFLVCATKSGEGEAYFPPGS